MLHSLVEPPGLRAFLAGVAAFLIVAVLGGWFIRLLIRVGLGENTDKTASEELARRHAEKKGTPTMGGALLVSAMILAGVLLADATRPEIAGLLGCVALAAGIGLYDDWIKLTRAHRDGISGRMKMALVLLLGGGLGALLVYSWGGPDSMYVPLSIPLPGVGSLALGWWIVPMAAVVMAGATNAMNLTDGLDGLAAGVAALSLGTLLVVALGLVEGGWLAGGRYGALPWAPDTAVCLSAAVGACLGFLWHNAGPARVFMGDTGSLALGAALGGSAILIRQELLLIVCAGVLVIEAGSVILQVGSYKLRGKRIFAIAPLHHHFQFKDWPENRVTVRFWIIGALLAAGALVLLSWSA